MQWIMDIDMCQLETFYYCIYFTEKMVACFLLKAHGYPSFRFLISLTILIMIHIAGIKSNQT